jgi:Flp pilus assembly pilin Flp
MHARDAARRAGMQNQRGQTTTEYGLILMIVSVAIIGIMLVAAGSLHELCQGAGDVVHQAVEQVLA